MTLAIPALPPSPSPSSSSSPHAVLPSPHRCPPSCTLSSSRGWHPHPRPLASTPSCSRTRRRPCRLRRRCTIALIITSATILLLAFALAVAAIALVSVALASLFSPLLSPSSSPSFLALLGSHHRSMALAPRVNDKSCWHCLLTLRRF